MIMTLLKPTCALLAALAVTMPQQSEGVNPAQSTKQTQELMKVRVIVPTRDNLQYMSFWVAKGAGYFRDENIQLILLIPPEPVLAKEMFIKKDAQVAVF